MNPAILGIVPWLFALNTGSPVAEHGNGPSSATEPSKPTVQSVQEPDPVASIWDDPEFKKRVARNILLRTELEPPMTVDEQEILSEVVEKISNEDYAGAIKQLKSSMGEESTEQFDFMLGYVHYIEQDMESARDAFQMAVQRFPNFLRGWKMLGQTLMQLEDYASARTAIAESIALGGADSDMFGVLGYAYTKLGNPVSASTAYEMASVLDPNNAQWRLGLAMSYFEQGRFEQAASFTGVMIKEDPESKRLWELQAKAYARMGKLDKAIENYEMIDLLELSDFESLSALGDLYVNEKLFDLAVNAYSRALGKESVGQPNRLILASQVMVANAAYPEALTMITSLEQKYAETLADNHKKDLFRLRSVVAASTDDVPAQIAALEEFLKVDPLDGAVLLQLGQLHYGRDEYDRAIFYFDLAADQEAFKEKATLGHGQSLVGLERYSDAIPYLQASIQINPRESVKRYLKQIEDLARTTANNN